MLIINGVPKPRSARPSPAPSPSPLQAKNVSPYDVAQYVNETSKKTRRRDVAQYVTEKARPQTAGPVRARHDLRPLNVQQQQQQQQHVSRVPTPAGAGRGASARGARPGSAAGSGKHGRLEEVVDTYSFNNTNLGLQGTLKTPVDGGVDPYKGLGGGLY